MKCRVCGKSGLFFKVNSNGLCINCEKKQYQPVLDFEIDSEKELRNQDKELAILVKAEELYKKDNDIERIIAVYEDVFITKQSTLNSQSRWFKLVDLYLKAGKNDKAWAWLDLLSIKHPDYLSKIEEKRFKILKKEGRFQDAMLSMMASIGYSTSNTDRVTYYQSYGKSKFLKDAPMLIKKLKWQDSDLLKLEAILSSSITKKQFDYNGLRDKYQRFLKSKQS